MRNNNWSDERLFRSLRGKRANILLDRYEDGEQLSYDAQIIQASPTYLHIIDLSDETLPQVLIAHRVVESIIIDPEEESDVDNETQAETDGEDDTEVTVVRYVKEPKNDDGGQEEPQPQ